MDSGLLLISSYLGFRLNICTSQLIAPLKTSRYSHLHIAAVRNDVGVQALDIVLTLIDVSYNPAVRRIPLSYRFRVPVRATVLQVWWARYSRGRRSC